MKQENAQISHRDRTYQQVDNGDYLTQKQYLQVAVTFGVIHIILEVLYIAVACTPMIYINIFSFLCYCLSSYLIIKDSSFVTIWIMEGEVYFHVVLASIFMGLKCGYHLWLFGIFSSIFLPYAMPNMSKRQRRQIGIYGIIIVVTFELLTLFDRIGIMPNAYEVPDRVARVMYYINASVGFCSIMIYTSFYNNRMAFKNKELVKAANFDFLTGVFNRQRMQTILSGETERAQNIDDSRLAVAILDIDFFKNINDTYGHKAGDDALMQISDIFREKEKEGLLFGRWGGEEFLLISPENISYEQFGNLLEDIRKTVEEHDFSTGKDSIKLTVSIGAVAFEKGMSAEKLVHIADDRLYEAKASGRNRVICK